MTMFSISALRVDHNLLVKQLQGAFLAYHANDEGLQKYIDALQIKSKTETNDAEKHAADRASLKADIASLKSGH